MSQEEGKMDTIRRRKVERVIDSLADLQVWATEMAPVLKTAPIITFSGDLGSGKTTLIKRLCTAWGVEENVSSPTFSIVNTYVSKDGISIHHMDLYRLESIEDAMNIGIEEYWYESGAHSLIEWPAIVAPILPDVVFEIHIDRIGAQQRKIVLLYPTS